MLVGWVDDTEGYVEGQGRGWLAPLGEALGRGGVRRLRCLELSTCPLGFADVGALLEGLEAGGVVLRRLQLQEVKWLPTTAEAVGQALAEGRGGLGRLEDLETDVPQLVGGIARAGAPCARTLARVHLLDTGSSFARAAASGFLQRLGEGGFPALVALEPDGRWAFPGLVRELVDALVSLAAASKQGGPPLRLESLSLVTKGDYGILGGSVNALTRAFAAGALRSLQKLVVMGAGYPEDDGVGAEDEEEDEDDDDDGDDGGGGGCIP